LVSVAEVYEFGQYIGTGSFGTVALVWHRKIGAARALKAISKNRSSAKMLRREIVSMAGMDHPHVIKLLGVFEDSKRVYLAMELAAGGELYEHIVEAHHFQEKSAGIVMGQILSAISYVHDCSVAHRDIKPENFVFSGHGPVEGNTLKLIDFGFACHCKPGQMLQSMIGSSIYMSPQVASGSYDLACDMWSAGAVMYVLLTGRPPIQGPSDAKTLALVRRGRWSFQGSLWQGVTAEAKQLVAALLAVKPSARSTAASALLHPWIQWSVGTVGV